LEVLWGETLPSGWTSHALERVLSLRPYFLPPGLRYG
jgi:hypothetical protein